MSALLIVIGYLVVISTGGWWGLAFAIGHIAILLLAARR